MRNDLAVNVRQRARICIIHATFSGVSVICYAQNGVNGKLGFCVTALNVEE